MSKLFISENKVKVLNDNGEKIDDTNRFKRENPNYESKFININNKLRHNMKIVCLEIDGINYGVDIQALKVAINNIEKTYSNTRSDFLIK